MITSAKKTFQDRPVPVKPHVSGKDAIKTIRTHQPTIFGFFVRNTNGNLVVLEAKLQKKKITDIEQYWLDIDPIYRQKARSRSKMHDREELNLVERHFYGFSHKISADGKKATVYMNQVPSKPVILNVDSEGELKAYVKIHKTLCLLDHVYIHYDPPSFLCPLGYVPWIRICGTDPQTGRYLKEKVIK